MQNKDIDVPKRYSRDELELLRVTFKDRADLLHLVRNLFFGFEIEDKDKEVIKNTFKHEQIKRLMRKVFLPELQPDIPIGQTVDLWMTVEIQGKSELEIFNELKAREDLIRALDDVLKLLDDPNSNRPDLKVDQPELVKLIARNQFIRFVETRLLEIQILANTKEESPEEKTKRIKKDSNR